MADLENSKIYLLNCDWLQFSCHFSGEIPLSFSVVRQEHSTRVFRTWLKIYYLDTYFCDMWYQPSSPILPKLLCSVKLSNESLYNPYLFDYLRKFIIDFKLHKVKISRYDLCCDFQQFANNYKVTDFLKSLVTSKILYNCRSSFRVSGISTNFQEVHSLSFGSRSSYIYVTLYDKTKEMRDVKVKNYIQKQWVDFGFNLMLPVWRLEFSINNNNEELTNSSSGEVYPINIDFLSKPFNLFHLFRSLVSKKFMFKKNEKKTNKSRYDNIKLFEFAKESITINRWNLHRDITRSIKIQINQRVKHILSLSKMEHNVYYQHVCTLYNFLSMYNMFDYYNKHFPDLDLFSILSDKTKIQLTYSNSDNFSLILP